MNNSWWMKNGTAFRKYISELTQYLIMAFPNPKCKLIDTQVFENKEKRSWQCRLQLDVDPSCEENASLNASRTELLNLAIENLWCLLDKVLGSFRDIRSLVEQQLKDVPIPCNAILKRPGGGYVRFMTKCVPVINKLSELSTVTSSIVLKNIGESMDKKEEDSMT